MLARVALRTTFAASTRCARHNVARRAVVRWMTTDASGASPSRSAAAPDKPEFPLNATSVQPSEDANIALEDVLDPSRAIPKEVPRNETDLEAMDEDGFPETGISAIHEFEESEAMERQAEQDLEHITEAQLSAVPLNGRSLIDPLYHPRTHGIPVALVQIRSYYPELLDLFARFSTHAASALAIPISRPTPLPIKRNLWTVLRSPFAHKKSQENFERKTYARVIKAWDADHEVIDRWALYLEKNILAGVGIRIVKWERAPVGVGRKLVDAVEDAMHPERQKPTNRDQIKALSEKIVAQELAAAAGHPPIEMPTKKASKPRESATKPKPTQTENSGTNVPAAKETPKTEVNANASKSAAAAKGSGSAAKGSGSPKVKKTQ